MDHSGVVVHFVDAVEVPIRTMGLIEGHFPVVEDPIEDLVSILGKKATIPEAVVADMAVSESSFILCPCLTLSHIIYILGDRYSSSHSRRDDGSYHHREVREVRSP